MSVVQALVAKGADVNIQDEVQLTLYNTVFSYCVLAAFTLT